MDFVSDVLPILPHRIDIIKYVIYGIASAFFVYGILLMVEGFFTSGAIKDLYGDFKITTCGRCVSAWVGLAPHHVTSFLAPNYSHDLIYKWHPKLSQIHQINDCCCVRQVQVFSCHETCMTLSEHV